jgi:pimeloyl-ACP methyl ester carboxylesterase
LLHRRSEVSAALLPELPRESVARVGVADCELRCLRIGVGRPVVLLHTLRTQLDYYLPLIGLMDLTRVEVIAVDLPGHGHSSAPAVDYTAGYFTEVVERFLDQSDVRDAIVVGDSIGATVALNLATRDTPRIAHVVAVNPYDYGRWGGIRRSSPLANILFTAMLWPVVGPAIAGSTSRAVLRRVLEGGLCHRGALPAGLVDELRRCGSLPGHARAFRSLNQHWRSWIAARSSYASIVRPVTLVYGSHDWSHPDERTANATAIPATRTVSIDECGHFASLEKPEVVAQLIREAT